MKSIVKRWSWVGLLLFAALGFFAAQSWAEDQIQWAPDFRTACGMAAEQRRIVLLHFYNDNCGPCVRLEKNVFSRPDVGEAVAQNFVAVKVHAGKQPQLASRYRVNQWPTDVFVTPSGLEVYRAISDQDSSKYIAVLNQVAQQTGVGAARQWKSQLGQVSQNAAAAATRAANASGTEAQHIAQQTGGEFQAAAGRAQQQWANVIQPPMAGAASQFQEAAGAARNVAQESTQQAVGTAQQFAGTAQQVAGTAQQAANQAQQQAAAAVEQTAERATQWSQQAASAVQSYQQQGGDSYRHFREQADGATQEIQNKMDTAKQTWNATTQQTTQEVGDAASGLKNQLQEASQSLLNRRSAFASADPSPAAAVAPRADSGNVTPAAAVQPASPQPKVTSQAPQISENPWVAAKQQPVESPPATVAPSAAPPLIAATPAASAPPFVPAQPQPPPFVAAQPQPPPFVAAQPQSPPFIPAQSQAQSAPQAAPPVAPVAPSVAGNLPMVPASQAPPVALDGFCPVTLLETMAQNPTDRGAWKKGDRQFGAIHRGRTYLFASAEQQRKFLVNPDAFAPALAGCDPVRFAERGEWVDGKRAFGIVTPSKHILLFADEASRNRFEQSPASYAAVILQAVAQSESGKVYR